MKDEHRHINVGVLYIPSSAEIAGKVSKFVLTFTYGLTLHMTETPHEPFNRSLKGASSHTRVLGLAFSKEAIT